MAWFGVTDAIVSTSAAPTQNVATGCPHSAMTNCWKSAFAAAAVLGNNVVSTGGMYLYSSLDVTPTYPHQTLTCDAAFTEYLANSDYSNRTAVAGAIVLAHGARIHFTKDANEFHHCVVLTIGVPGTGTSVINLAPNSAGNTQKAALDNDKYMVANGDVGIFCDNADSNYIHDVTVIGFDTGIGSLGCAHWRVENANIDAPVGIHLQSNKSPAYINHVRVEPMLSSNVTDKNLFYTGNAISVTSSGGACEIDVPVGTNVRDDDWVSLAGNGNPGDEGPLSCYGTFQATLNSDNSHILLRNSMYSAPTGITANWVANSNIVNVTSVDGIQQGQCITSNDPNVFNGYTCNSAPGVMVKEVSYYSKKIVIGQLVPSTPPTVPPTIGAVLTKDPSPSNATLSFSNNGGSYGGIGSTFIVAAAPHISAGNSLGGVAAGGIATCIMGGGPGDTSTLGFIGGDIFCFEHRRQINAASLGPFSCHGCGFDSKATLFDIKQIGVLFGRGIDALPLTGSVTTSMGVSTLTVASDATQAGWNVNDTLISSNEVTNGLNGQTITSINGGVSVVLSSTVGNGSAGTVYDVKGPVNTNPAILNGTVTTAGSYTIMILGGANPKLVWSIGDILVEPVHSAIPPGARIVSMTTSSVTLNVPVTTTFTNAPIGDTTVNVVGTRGGDFAAAVLGGGGGFVLDSNASGCNAVHGKIDEANVGQPALEVVQGCALVTNVSESQNNGFMIDVGGVPNTTTLMTGSYSTGGIAFEGALASSSFAGNENTFSGGGTVNTQTFGNTLSGVVATGYYPCPTVSANILVVFCGGNGLYGTSGDGTVSGSATAGGNAYETCNQRYPVAGVAGCVQTAMDSSGKWKLASSTNVPFYEFNDMSQTLLPLPYRDGIQAGFSPTSVLQASISVVSSCFHPGCTFGGAKDPVKLPSATNWVDAGAWSGTACAGGSSGNCGVGGSISIANANASDIQVLGSTGDTINGVLPTIGVTLPHNSSKTFYAVSGVGWISN